MSLCVIERADLMVFIVWYCFPVSNCSNRNSRMSLNWGNPIWLGHTGAIRVAVTFSSLGLSRQCGIRAVGVWVVVLPWDWESIYHQGCWVLGPVSSCSTEEVGRSFWKQICWLRRGPICFPTAGMSHNWASNCWRLSCVKIPSLLAHSLLLEGALHGWSCSFRCTTSRHLLLGLRVEVNGHTSHPVQECNPCDIVQTKEDRDLSSLWGELLHI